MTESRKTSIRSVFNPAEQRIYGLVKIAEGLTTLVLGKHAPSWTYEYARWGARRASKRRLSAENVDGS